MTKTVYISIDFRSLIAVKPRISNLRMKKWFQSVDILTVTCTDSFIIFRTGPSG